MRDVWITAAFLATLLPVNAAAHGIWGHVHVTGWAVENMADDELRQFLLDDPEVFNALLFGAVFTDTGYSRDEAASRAYSEHAHWEPFIQDYIDWIRLNDPPPWTSGASKKRVAFLMGCASHGLQDSIFDSLFLHQVEAHDGASQSAPECAVQATGTPAPSRCPLRLKTRERVKRFRCLPAGPASVCKYIALSKLATAVAPVAVGDWR